MDKELWEIELDLKTAKFEEAHKKYESTLKGIHESEKRLTAAVINEEKRTTQAKISESRIREATVKAELNKELVDYKQTLAEKNRLQKESAAQLKAQTKSDSKFTNQSVTLGSIDAINMQIAHYNRLRNSVQANSEEGRKYAGIVSDLTAKKRELTGATGGLTGMISRYGAGLVAAIGIQTAFNTALNSAKFNVMREMFQGSEKDIQAFRNATANTVSDASLIALSNQASDLNINLKDQAILFSFAETVADKYNTSTEEGFAKVFTVMQGSTKGLKDLGVSKSAFLKLTEELSQKQGKEVDEQIRLQAIIQLTNTTYDEAINKQMDQADVLETVKVQVKNVADEHGNLWDVLSSLNPVTGFFNVGLEDMAKKETKAKEDAMLLIGSLDSYNSKVPVWGAATEDLRNYFISLAETFLTTANTAGALQDALSGTSINRKGGNASIETQASSKIKKSGTGSRGSSGFTPEATLNFLEQLRKNITDIETDIVSLNALLTASNLADYEKLTIQDHLIAKQKELNNLKRVNMGLEATSITGSLPGSPSLRIGRQAFGGDGGSAMDGNTVIKRLMEEEQAKYQAIIGYVGQIESGFINMLQTTGLINNDFVQILNMIKSIIGSGTDIIGGILDLAGLLFAPVTGGASIPIAAGIGGTISGGMPNYPMPNSSPLVAPVIINNPITLRQGLQIENKIDAVRGTINL